MDRPQLITAMAAIVSLAIGALLQHVLGTRAEARKQQALLRMEAYADFLRGVSILAASQSPIFPQDEAAKALALVGDARARIAIYGSVMTVKAMAAFSPFSQLTSRQACVTFVRACQQMRRDTHAESAITDDELSLLLFSKSLKDLPEQRS
jgi:hypothetical protein